MPVPSRMREVCAADLRQEHEGRRQSAFAFVEMVLRDPGGIEAAALGVDDLLRWRDDSARPPSVSSSKRVKKPNRFNVELTVMHRP